EEIFGRREGEGAIAERPDKAVRCFAYRGIVVDDRDHRRIHHGGALPLQTLRSPHARHSIVLLLPLDACPQAIRRPPRRNMRERANSIRRHLAAKLYLGIAAQVFRRIPSASAMRTRSVSDFAPILRMTLPRWTFTVITLTPISAAICLFINPAVTWPISSCSRLVSDSCSVLSCVILPSCSRRVRSRSSAT